MSVSAVIPVHNRADLLEKLLATMRLQTVPFDEILVIDNASTDGAAAIATAAGCTVIPMGINSGFAAAVNRGWREAHGDWVAVINSDVELEPDWLARLLEAAGNASFATGKILRFNSNHTIDVPCIDATYDLVARSGCAWRAGHGEPDRPCGFDTMPIAIAPATACLYRRAVLAALNGFDESYGSYLEDVDLGLRCLNAGFTGLYVPRAIARHHGSATLGRWNGEVVRLISRNQLRLISRHYDRRLFRACFWPILAGQLLWGLVALRHGAFRPWIEGKRQGLAGFRLQGKPSPALEAFLDSSEREIEARTAEDYWLFYFRCAPARQIFPILRRNDT